MSNNGVLQSKNVKYLPASTTTYNITMDDDIIMVNSSLNAVTLVLPNIRGGAILENPKCFKINDYSGNAATNNITIQGCGGDTVNSSSFIISTNSDSAEVNVVNPDEWFASSASGSSPVTGFVPYVGATQNVNLGSFGLTTFNLVVGTQVGGYVTSGAHKAQVVADSATQTPLVVVGGSGAIEFWKDTTPTAAVAYGMAVPGSAATNDFVLSAYNGATWAQIFSVSQAGDPLIAATNTYQGGAYAVTGTAGFGNISFSQQSAKPAFPISGFKLYSGSTNTVNWISPNSYITRLDSTANTADRTYTFPDASGTIALTSSLSGYVPYTGATSNVDLGTFTLTTPNVIGVSGSLLFTNAVTTSGTTIDFRWNKAAHTGQTASSPINGFLFVSGTRQWNTGAITSQMEFEITAPTYSFVGASTITNAFTAFFNRPNAGTNATITNRWALGTLGPAKFSIASSGLTSPVGGTTVAVESNTTNYLSFMQPDASLGGITWGSPTDSFGAVINWSLNNNSLDIQTARSSGIIRFYAGDQALAATLSTTLLTFASGVNVTTSGTSLSFTATAASSGAVNTFTWTVPNNTGQTASAECNGFNYASYTRTWAAGTITTQREQYIRTVTYAFASASTITNAYALYIEAPTAGSNATITNNFALGLNGSLKILDGFNIVVDTTTGTKIGTSTTQKIGFWNATPIVQPTTAFAAATYVANSSANILYNESTFDGYTIAQVVKALRTRGDLA